MPNEVIAKLLCKEIASIQNPNNPADVYTFHQIEELVEILIAFLNYDCNEPLVAETGNKVLGAFSVFSSTLLDTEKISPALEDLATGFESYLKKIAILKYKDDQDRLYGDNLRYRGLLNTSLGGLLDGKVAKVNPRDGSVRDLLAPLVTFTYAESNVREAIYNHVRNLRNRIHNASPVSLFESMQMFRLAASSYLFATEENLLLIRRSVDPIFSYLIDLESKFKKWEYKYVELTGEERRDILLDNWPDLQALEWSDESQDRSLSTFPWEDEQENPTLSDQKSSTDSLRTPITGLPELHKRFWLIGEPGSGKTTTLQKLAWHRANEILSVGYLIKPCPVFISANQFDHEHRFREIASELLKIDVDQVDDLIWNGKLCLLIDAINEISVSEQEHAISRLNALNLM